MLHVELINFDPTYTYSTAVSMFKTRIKGSPVFFLVLLLFPFLLVAVIIIVCETIKVKRRRGGDHEWVGEGESYIGYMLCQLHVESSYIGTHYDAYIHTYISTCILLLIGIIMSQNLMNKN